MKSLLKALATALDSRGLPYMVIGGQAVLLHGEPRFTKDIDVTLGVLPDRLPEVLDLTRSLDLRVLPENPTEFVHRTYVLPCMHDESTLGVDFVFSFSPFEREAIGRGVVRRIDKVDVRYASAEDLLIQKIVASRPRDLDDAKAIAFMNRDLDDGRIKYWLKEFGELLGSDFLRTWESIRPA